MVLSILFGKKYSKSKVDSIELDITLREDHKYASRVTTYPVETGYTLSDNIINDPTTLTLEGIVTDDPLNVMPKFSRSINALGQLVKLHHDRQPVDVVTGLKVYKNFAITLLTIPRDITTGESAKFIIELQEVLVDAFTTLESIDVFGGVQSKIPEEIVSDGASIPLINNDPPLSLKDQATSGADLGLQSLNEPPPNILDKIKEGANAINTY